MESISFFEREPRRSIETWFKIFFPEEAFVEVRIIGFNESNKVIVRHFRLTDINKEIVNVLRFADRSTATYFMLNPIHKDSPVPAKDTDVLWRNWLLLDFDPVRETKISSTDEEKAEARALCRTVYKFLDQRGWPEPIVADSGNGFHALYHISLPNTTVERDLVKNVTLALSKKFDTEMTKIDRSTYNASRLTKIYGTLARKGPSTALRPHRPSRLIYVPQDVEIVPRDLLEDLIKECNGGTQKINGNTQFAEFNNESVGKESFRKGTSSPRTRSENSDPIYRATRYLESFPPAISGQHGHNTTFRAACSAGPGFGLTEEQLITIMRDVYNPKCIPPWGERDLYHKVREAYKREERRRGWMLEK